MIIGTVARARAGKDTLADLLVSEFGFLKMSFAEPLKDAFANYHGIPRCWCDGVDEDGSPLDREQVTAFFDITNRTSDLTTELDIRDVTIRQGLQRFGTEMGRNTFGEDFWLDRLDDRLADAYGERVIITDPRFENELHFLNELNAIVIGIDRPGATIESDHVSENLQGRIFEPGFCDHIISNGGTLAEYQDEIRTIMKGIL